MIRRQVVKQVGPLDEAFYLFLEETDWCYRIKQAGWRIYWLPQAKIIHYGQQSTSKDPPRFLPELYRSYCRYYRKHYGASARVVALKAIIALAALLRLGLWTLRFATGRSPHARRMLQGYATVLARLPTF
jgi:GT2 family glycosyltransferase